MANETVEKYQESMKQKAEQLIYTEFPRKITLLNDLLASLQLNDTTEIHKEITATPSSGTVECNHNIVQLITTMKPHIKQLLEDANTLKIWISSMIPKIEDTNSLGVMIQKKTLKEIMLVESKATDFYYQVSKYFTQRAKVISKITKFPKIEDYKEEAKQLDEQMHTKMLLKMREICNRYSTLHSAILKNLEKIKMPASSNAESLY